MITPLKVSQPPTAPLVIFDGECRFCRFWVERWKVATEGRVAFAPFQEEAARFPEIPEEAFQRALQFIAPDGTVYPGADGFFRLMAYAPMWQWLARSAPAIPGVLAASRAGYSVVAAHRGFFSLLTRAFWGDDPAPSAYLAPRRVFSFGLGLIFLAAFASLAVQLDGLIGSRGIMPAHLFLRAAGEQIGSGAWEIIPSIFWLSGSDAALHWACGAGFLFSALLLAGIAPGACALACWVLYLSFCSVASPFLDFQWDTLLLETALVATVYLPWRPRPRWARISAPSRLGRWLAWWLVFRLMFESGVVKLTSGDTTWRDFTALRYHFETQPLPLWTAWYAHQAPLWAQKAATFTVLAIEIGAPLLIFTPRRLRHAAAAALIALQIGILATGNYAFFNALSILLCLPLLDDRCWPRRWSKPPPADTAPSTNRCSPAAAVACACSGVCILLLTGPSLLESVGMRLDGPRALEAAVAPLRSFNAYGLFRVMTTERREIIVEGSDDGVDWRPYEFRWKPGDLSERPRWAAPHQPRLDWQMWFAALGSYRENFWFVRFAAKLLEGSQEVTALLRKNPFPDHPPRYIRALSYQYHFTSPGSRNWWRRDSEAMYLPPISRADLEE